MLDRTAMIGVGEVEGTILPFRERGIGQLTIATRPERSRTHARLETGDPRYDWVNKTLFVGTGTRKKTTVQMSLFAIK